MSLLLNIPSMPIIISEEGLYKEEGRIEEALSELSGQ